MSTRRILVALGFLMVRAGALDAQEKLPPGYRDVFISLPNYQAEYKAPVVEKGDKPKRYSQQATYEWTGGRLERIVVILARDPAFKERYSPDALKKETTAPKELKLNDKRALLWSIDEPKQPDGISQRLVVLLADDKAILIEQHGFGASVEDVARQFDFPKVEKALSNPPQR